MRKKIGRRELRSLFAASRLAAKLAPILEGKTPETLTRLQQDLVDAADQYLRATASSQRAVIDEVEELRQAAFEVYRLHRDLSKRQDYRSPVGRRENVIERLCQICKKLSPQAKDVILGRLLPGSSAGSVFKVPRSTEDRIIWAGQLLKLCPTAPSRHAQNGIVKPAWRRPTRQRSAEDMLVCTQLALAYYEVTGRMPGRMISSAELSSFARLVEFFFLNIGMPHKSARGLVDRYQRIRSILKKMGPIDSWRGKY